MKSEISQVQNFICPRGVRQPVQQQAFYARLLVFNRALAQPHFCSCKLLWRSGECVYSPCFNVHPDIFAVMNCCVVALGLFSSDIPTWSADIYFQCNDTWSKGSACKTVCILRQQTSPKRWFGNMTMTWRQIVTSQTVHTKYKCPQHATEWKPSMKTFCVRHCIPGWDQARSDIYIITSPDPCTTSGRLPSGCRTCGAKLFWDILATRLNQRSWVLYIRRSGSRQYRSNATPLDAFHDVPSCVLSWTRQNMRRPVSLGILPRFLEKLLESLSLVSSAAAVTITALDIIKLWFHYFTSSFCKAQHISL